MVRVDIIEDVEMVKVTLESVCSIFSWSRSGIQLTQNGIKLFKFGDNEKGQTSELVGYEKVLVDITNISVVENDNCFQCKNNVEYTWAKFIQVSKIIKELMTMFFTNSNLAPMWEYLSYKNVNKMRALLIQLLYSKVT